MPLAREPDGARVGGCPQTPDGLDMPPGLGGVTAGGRCQASRAFEVELMSG